MRNGASERTMRFIVIGAGVSGILAAIRLKHAGYTEIAVYEKGDSVGGTWRENQYPGLTCDLAAHAYTYSFERNPDWSQMFAPGPEIHQYLIRTADKYGVTDLIHFEEEVTECHYDGGRWYVRTAKGTEDWGDFVIAASGVLHHPNIPTFAGQEDFKGAIFHSTKWDHEVSLEGKRIAIIGTGSTGIQLVTALQPTAAKVYQVQRTAQWVREIPFETYSEEDKQRFRDNPNLIEEMAAGWVFGEGARIFMTGVINEASAEMHQLEELCQQDLESKIQDPELRAVLRPDYRPACKRLVFSWNYFDAVQRDNVEIVTDRIDRLTEHGIRFESGREIEVDVIALATGFDVSKFIRPTKVTGLGGCDLDSFWTPDPKSYGALAMPGFPNFFFINGPNGPVGNFSLIDVAERQMDYIMQMIEALEAVPATAVQVTQHAFDDFQKRQREAAKNTIWATGCKSWYLDSQGLPFVWALPVSELLDMLERPRFEDYEFLDEDGNVIKVDVPPGSEPSPLSPPRNKESFG